jgi:hypothetical protein
MNTNIMLPECGGTPTQNVMLVEGGETLERLLRLRCDSPLWLSGFLIWIWFLLFCNGGGVATHLAGTGWDLDGPSGAVVH